MIITINQDSWTNPVSGITSYYGGQPLVFDADFLGNPDDFIDGKWNEGFAANIMGINMPSGYGKGTEFIFDGQSVDNDLGGVLADMCHYCEVHDINGDYLTEEEYQQALIDGDEPEWFCEVIYSDSFNWKSAEHCPDILYYLPEQTMSEIRPQVPFDSVDLNEGGFQQVLNEYMLAYKFAEMVDELRVPGETLELLAIDGGLSPEEFPTFSKLVDWCFDKLQLAESRSSLYDAAKNYALDGDWELAEEIKTYTEKIYPELVESADICDVKLENRVGEIKEQIDALCDTETNKESDPER